MKKQSLIWLSVLVILLAVFPKSIMPLSSSAEQEKITSAKIPHEAIRFRIIANSNDDLDQHVKYMIRDYVNAYIIQQMQQVNDIESARVVIERELPEIEKIVREVLDDYELNQPFQVEYKDQILFPEKTYGQYTYEAGYYEAVVITLGDGVGENWWCVLFPPLCFISFSNDSEVVEAKGDEIISEEKLEVEKGETEASNEELDDESEEVEFKFFIFDLLGLS